MPHHEIVYLTWGEVDYGARIGCIRQGYDLRVDAKHRYGYEGDGWGSNICGAQGELATAKYLDRFWSGAIGDFDAPDVGARIQVRASYLPHANLIVHPPPTENKRGDKPNDYFICARVLLQNRLEGVITPVVHLMGWRPGAYAQRDQYWKELQKGRPAFVVPVAELLPMVALKSLTNSERAA